jgi:flavin-binding protein dodecin
MAPGFRAAERRDNRGQENTMSEHVYKHIELTGSSTQSSDDAVRVALTKASKTLRGIHWFQVTDTRGHVEDGKVAHWQVTIKVGLRIDD